VHHMVHSQAFRIIIRYSRRVRPAHITSVLSHFYSLSENCSDSMVYLFIILIELMYMVFVNFDWTRALSPVCFWSSKMKNNVGLNASFQELIHVLMVPMKSQTE
jgi:hypothetical protein